MLRGVATRATATAAIRTEYSVGTAYTFDGWEAISWQPHLRRRDPWVRNDLIEGDF